MTPRFFRVTLCSQAALLSLGVLGGCDGDEKIDSEDDPAYSSEDDDDGTTTDGAACTDDTDCGAGRICEDGTCETGDRNVTPDDAEPLRFGSTDDESSYVRGLLQTEDDVDWYAIEADGGEFVRIATYTDEEDPTRDTVVSLYRDNGKLITYANGYAAGGGVGDADSIVYAYLSEAGTYHVKVEDDATFFGEGEPSGDLDYTYDLLLTEWSGVTAEPDAPEDPRAGITVASERSWSAVGVLLEEPGDTDYIAIRHDLDGYGLYIDGNYDLSGSDADPLVRLVDASSGELYAEKASNGLNGQAFFPALPAGDYRVEVSDAAGGGGPDHWLYVYTLAVEADDRFEVETESNDTATTAFSPTPEALETDSGNPYTIARVEGLADTEGDEDWLSVRSDFDDGRIVVCLNSAWYGATTSPTIELWDASGTTLLDDAAPDTTGSYPTTALSNVEVPTGDYAVRIVHPEGAGARPSDWWRAYIYVASFEVTSFDCP